MVNGGGDFSAATNEEVEISEEPQPVSEVKKEDPIEDDIIESAEKELEEDLEGLKLDDIDTTDVNLDDELLSD